MASQITSLTIVYSIVYSRYISKKTSKLRVTGLCVGNSPVTCEFPAQRASNAENVSIWWHHHVVISGAMTMCFFKWNWHLSLGGIQTNWVSTVSGRYYEHIDTQTKTSDMLQRTISNSSTSFTRLYADSAWCLSGNQSWPKSMVT